MSKLEKYLAKAQEPVQRRTATVTIDGDEWSVQELTFSESRQCLKLAEDENGRFDAFRYNDIRIVKATEHDFPWHNMDLLKSYKAKDKFEMPVKLFDRNPEAYQALLDKVNEVNSRVKTEQQVVEDLKNSSEPTEKQATSVGHSSTEEDDQSIS